MKTDDDVASHELDNQWALLITIVSVRIVGKRVFQLNKR